MRQRPVSLLTTPASWLGGGTHLRQFARTIERSGVSGDRVVEVGSLRGGNADIRLPAGLVSRLGTTPTRALGQLLWRGVECAHRASIDIPPAGHEVISVLDLAPLHFRDEGHLPRTLHDQARRAVGLLVSSELIADEVQEVLRPAQVWLAPPAVEARFFSLASRDRGGRPFVLHVGGATKRKGLDLLALAWDDIRAVEPELDLVMVGPPHPTGRAALVGRPGVTWLGPVGDDEVVSLMSAARALVVPSTYEGFGMPVPEALAMGTPVVVVEGTAPSEIGGEIAFRASSDGDPSSLAEAVLTAARAREDATDRLRRGRARAQRWSTAASSAAQLAAYDAAFG